MPLVSITYLQFEPHLSFQVSAKVAYSSDSQRIPSHPASSQLSGEHSLLVSTFGLASASRIIVAENRKSQAQY